MIIFVFSLIEKWIKKEDDSLLTIVKNIDGEKLGGVDFGDTGILLTFLIYDMA